MTVQVKEHQCIFDKTKKDKESGVVKNAWEAEVSELHLEDSM